MTQSCCFSNLGCLQIPISYISIEGPPGPTGATGNSVLSGSGAPSSSLGQNGDFYIDTAALDIYGPKTAGAWGSGTSLVGPTGPQGVAVLNTDYGAVTNSVLYQSWVQAKTYSLGASYIDTAKDGVEIEVQGSIPVRALLSPAKFGRIRFRWGVDFVWTGPLVGAAISGLTYFKMNLKAYVQTGGSDMFYAVSFESTPAPVIDPYPATPNPGSIFTQNGTFALSDPSIAQSLYIDLWNDVNGSGSQISVNSFVVKSFNAS